MFQYSVTERTVPVPVSVPGKRFRRFRFRVQFLGKRFRRFRFPVPVRFLGHPVKAGRSDVKFGGIRPPAGPQGASLDAHPALQNKGSRLLSCRVERDTRNCSCDTPV